MLVTIGGHLPERPSLGASPQIVGGPRDSIEAVKAALRAHFVGLGHEQLHAYFLAPGMNGPLSGIHFRGAFDHVSFDARLIFNQALLFGAHGLILAHNHPSGDPTPSRADIAVTKDIFAGCRLVGLRLHDHLIVAGDRHFSFREAGLL